jgi:GH43 family beta-xylosidase
VSCVRYTNPVFAGYLADPYVWRARGEYFAIGTGREEANGVIGSEGQAAVFPLLRSDDLVNWRAWGHALVRPSPSYGNTYWAPEVVAAEGSWWLYYSVGIEDRMHQLRVARSDQPEGPYTDCAALTELNSCAFAIDPHAFCDEDGRWYLFHARDFLDLQDDNDQPVRAGTALAVSPMISMTELAAKSITVARARHDWQRFAANRTIYDRIFDWHTLEGPCVIKHSGKYYCFYSGGCWQTDSYGVDYVVAEKVLGPYIDQGIEEGPRVLRTVANRVIGPGHCSIVIGPGEATHVIVYHAWGADMDARRMFIDPLTITSEGVSCEGPTWTEHSLSSVPRAERDLASPA